MTDADHIVKFTVECADALSLMRRDLPPTEWDALTADAFDDLLLALDDEFGLLPLEAIELARAAFTSRLSELSLMPDTSGVAQ